MGFLTKILIGFSILFTLNLIISNVRSSSQFKFFEANDVPDKSGAEAEAIHIVYNEAAAAFAKVVDEAEAMLKVYKEAAVASAKSEADAKAAAKRAEAAAAKAKAEGTTAAAAKAQAEAEGKGIAKRAEEDAAAKAKPEVEGTTAAAAKAEADGKAIAKRAEEDAAAKAKTEGTTAAEVDGKALAKRAEEVAAKAKAEGTTAAAAKAQAEAEGKGIAKRAEEDAAAKAKTEGTTAAEVDGKALAKRAEEDAAAKAEAEGTAAVKRVEEEAAAKAKASDPAKTYNSGNSTDSIKGIEPIILPLENRSKHHLFVHIGKAGGSSIMLMVKKSHEKCQELKLKDDDNDNDNNNNSSSSSSSNSSSSLLLLKTQVCALATIPNGRVHLNARLHPQKYYSKYTQFFINVRDPIDRLISWYNYEIISFKREPRFTTANETGQASDNFLRLSQCFPGKNGFTNMVNGGLLSASSSSSSNNSNNEATNCNELARLCLRGDIMCFGHNYYNYEVYLEEILLRKGFSTSTATTTSTKKENNGNTISNENNSNIDSNIRIDVLRAEHSMDDFNRTVGLWTINNTNKNEKIEEFVGITDFVQGLYGRVRTKQQYNKGKTKNNNDDDGILSSEASAALCKHICTELIVYKLILKASNNLYGSEIRDSYIALDQRCGFIVDDVCGTTWTYRDVKTKKNVFDAPW